MSRTRSAPRLIGFEFDAATGTARFSMYVPGTAGRERKRATVHAATYDEAVQQWSAFRARVKTGSARPNPEAPTFREFIAEFWPTIEASVSPRTARDYRYVVDRHLQSAFGALRLTEMTSGVLNRFGARLKAAGYAGATVNNYVNVAALLLGYAVEFDVIEELPLKKKLKRQKANKPCFEMNADERKRFLAAFDDEEGFRAYLRASMPRGEARAHADLRFGSKRRYGAGMRDTSEAATFYFQRFRRSRLLFIVALETGLRKNDLRKLKCGSVKVDDGWITRIQQKTGREVVIPISQACRRAIAEALAGREVDPDNHVFVTESGEPYSESTIDRYFTIAKRLAGITRRMRFHDLRHTFGSDLATAGLPLPFIGKVMGHTNPATTARYARPDAVVLERVRDALDRARD